LLQLYRELQPKTGQARKVQTSDLATDWSIPTSLIIKRALILFGYLAGLLIGITSLGFFIAMPLFAFSYLKFHGKETWLLSLVLAAVVLLLLEGFDRVLHPVWIEGVVPWPEGMLGRLLDF